MLLKRIVDSDRARVVYSRLTAVPVAGTLVQKLACLLVPRGRVWVRVPLSIGGGFWMYANLRSERGYTNGDHEVWLQELLQSELRPGDCYYDIGAHSGFFSLIAAYLVGPSGTVLAVEPDPRNAAVIRANIERNMLRQVMVVEAAVWSESGFVAFASQSEGLNGTQSHILSRDSNVSEPEFTVPAVRLDDLIFHQGRRPPDLVKMDIEGAEWDALHAAPRLLSEVKPRLFCEVHDPSQMKPLRSYLEQFGYNVEEWRPVDKHYSDYHQVYLWAKPTTKGSATRPGHQFAD